MSDFNSRHRHKHRKTSGKGFLILPVMFFAVICLAVYIAIFPSLKLLKEELGVLFSDSVKNYSSDEYKNIFVPVAEKPTEIITDSQGKVKEQPTELETVPARTLTYPSYNNLFGELIIEECGIDVPLFFGDDDVALRNGVGIYAGSFIPGYGGTILIAGHNNTYFNGLKNAAKGQIVRIKTSYGNYQYRINDVAVKKANDGSAYDLSAPRENLIMYTCYPFDELGLTPWRCFVYGELISGPQVVDKYEEEDDEDDFEDFDDDDNADSGEGE